MDPAIESPVDLPGALAEYLDRWPAEAAVVYTFGELAEEDAARRRRRAESDASVASDSDPYTRERLAGHFTASTWLVDHEGARVLLTHHRKLDRWLQLGGHADGDRSLARAALREAQEESGLPGLRVEPQIFDLDRHRIPEHKGVPEHWHYDVRFVVRAGDDEAFVVSDESHALAWRGIDDVATDERMDASLRRMARKWLARPL